MTDNGYEENVSKMSCASKPNAGPGPVKYANPVTPMKVMAKATGILSRKSKSSRIIPTIPVVTGLIFLQSSKETE